jgi:hypothetical protein
LIEREEGEREKREKKKLDAILVLTFPLDRKGDGRRLL